MRPQHLGSQRRVRLWEPIFGTFVWATLVLSVFTADYWDFWRGVLATGALLIAPVIVGVWGAWWEDRQ